MSSTLSIPTHFGAACAYVEARAASFTEDVLPLSAVTLLGGSSALLGPREVTLSPLALQRLLAIVGVKASWMASPVRLAQLNAILKNDPSPAYRFRRRGSEVVTVLPVSFSAIGLARVFAGLKRYLCPVLDRYTILRFDDDGESIQVTFALPQGHVVGGALPGFRSDTGSRGVAVLAGWHLSMSENGQGPVEVFDAMLRGSDGSTILGRAGRAFYTRTHRPGTDEEVVAGFMVALAHIDELPLPSGPEPEVPTYKDVLREGLRTNRTGGVPVPVAVCDAAARAAEAHAGEGPVTRDAVAWGLAECAPNSPLYVRTAVELVAGRILGNPKA